ncbi:hypothetical protein V5O48_014256 [Marasmius crinis-equi]|uniref:Uncharacterized protein n=1 Tax=Marasmius crinis-equi TaxID=585013 RepID=A0ABR3EY79_9AGAR
MDSARFEELSDEIANRDRRIASLERDQEVLRLSEQEKATRLEESETALMDLRTVPSPSPLFTAQIKTDDTFQKHDALLMDSARFEELSDEIANRDRRIASLERDQEVLRANEQEKASRLIETENSLMDLQKQNKALLSCSVSRETWTNDIARREVQIAHLQNEQQAVLLREGQQDGQLRSTQQALDQERKRLQDSEKSLKLLEAAHKKVLAESSACEGSLRTEVLTRDDRIAELQLAQRNAHSREIDLTSQLRANDALIQQLRQGLVDSETSLAQVKTSHNDLFMEKSTCEDSLRAEVSARDEQISALRLLSENSKREMQLEIVGLREEAARLQSNYATAAREATSRDNAKSSEIRARDANLLRQEQELQKLQQAHQEALNRCNEEHALGLNDLRAQIRDIRSTSENKDQTILDLEASVQRSEMELSQVNTRANTLQNDHDELTRRNSVLNKEILAVRGEKQTLTNHVVEVFAGLNIGSSTLPTTVAPTPSPSPLPNPPLLSSRSRAQIPSFQNNRRQDVPPQPNLSSFSSRPRAQIPSFQGSRHRGAAPSLNSSAFTYHALPQIPSVQDNSRQDVLPPLTADPHGNGPTSRSSATAAGNYMATNFQRSTLRGTNVVKEQKRGQRTLRKYRLLSPIPTPDDTSATSRKKDTNNKQTPWQKKTGRSPYIQQQDSKEVFSTSESSSDSSDDDGDIDDERKAKKVEVEEPPQAESSRSAQGLP